MGDLRDLSDIAIFSLNGNKDLTTGGGGMIVTDGEARAARAVIVLRDER